MLLQLPRKVVNFSLISTISHMTTNTMIQHGSYKENQTTRMVSHGKL